MKGEPIYAANLLALETSGDICSAALLRDGQFLVEHTFRHGMHLSERLMGQLESLLKEADITLKDVNVFAVGVGPGSFTGTRIGVMTMKTLASVLNKPLYGISGLEGLAVEYAGLHNTIIAPLLPCRPGVVYTGLFRVDGGTPQPITEPDALSLTELADRLAEMEAQQILFCGPARARYEAELKALFQEGTRNVAFTSADFPRAARIAQIAFQQSISGERPEDPITLVPLYISPPPITMPKNPIPQPVV